MDKTKVVILVLVLLVIIAFMALGAGAYRDSQEGTELPSNYQPKALALKAVGAVTGAFRSKFDLNRLRGCNRSGATISLSGSCEMTVAPGSSRPSKFRLARTGGTVHLCFAMSRGKLNECRPKAEELEDPADLTVASDSAYLFLECKAPSGCTVTVSRR